MAIFKKSPLLVVLLVVFCLFQFYNFYHHKESVLPLETQSPPAIYVSARVGQYYINSLTGWTSPYAEVNLTGKNLIRKTTADAHGFFAFYFIPVIDELSEMCLVAQDVNLLPTFPVCLPPPDFNRPLEIHNVLLPPTISIEGEKIPAGQTAKASGMTTPNAEVNVYFFTEPNWSFWAKVLAFSLPQYRVKANQNGYFEFSLPATTPARNGLFATANIQLSPETPFSSPKSNTLYFQTLGWLGLIKLFFLYLWQNFLAFLTTVRSSPVQIIILEIIALIWLLILLLTSRLKPKEKKPVPQPLKPL